MHFVRTAVVVVACCSFTAFAQAPQAQGQGQGPKAPGAEKASKEMKAQSGEAAKKAPAKPTVPPELEKLKWMVGTWSVKASWEASPMGPAGSTTGTEVVTRGPGGMSLLGNFTGKMPWGPYSGHSINTWDPSKGALVTYWTDSMAPGVVVMTGKQEGENVVYTGEGMGPDGKPEKMRHTMSNITPKGYTYTMESEVNGQWLKSMTMTYTKKK
jgi:hypothetical protein